MTTPETTPDHPQIYLITPPTFELSTFPRDLAAALDAVDIACLRLSLASHDEDEIIRASDALREVTEPRDVALVIDTHVQLAERLGLDGVHLRAGGAKAIRAARAALGAEAIVGAHAGTSRHEGLNLGEAGADYVCFGPAGVSPLGDGAQAERDLFVWWTQMIELPVVAEGALDEDVIASLRDQTDFFAIGQEVWESENPLDQLQRMAALIASA